MWKNTVQPDRPQMTIWIMRKECSIPKATNIHSDYVTRIDFHAKYLLERTLMLSYTYIINTGTSYNTSCVAEYNQ